MSLEIELPDGTLLDAPDDADPSAVAKAYMSKQKPSAPSAFAGDDLLSNDAMSKLSAGDKSTVAKRPSIFDRALGYGSNYFEGLNRAGSALQQPTRDVPGVGALESLGTIATGLVAPIPGALESAVLGTPYRKARDKYIYQPQTQSGQAMTQGLGAMMQPVGDVSAIAGKAIGNALDFVPGVTQQGGQEAGAAAMDALSMAGLLRQQIKGPSQPKAAAQKEPTVPTTAELKNAKNLAYDAAKNAGAVINNSSFSKFTQRVTDSLSKEHLNATLHPGTSAALQELVDTAKRGNHMSLEELDQLRQIVRDAPTTKADARLSKSVVKQIDDYLDNLDGRDIAAGNVPEAVSALKEARALNRRVGNSEMFDELLRKAGINASAKFTQAGEEHALRSEFKKLALNTRAMQKFSAAEKAAIEKVATGGSWENAMRDLGKFDPTTGGMSTLIGLSVGGGLGSLGGLESAGLGAVAVPAIGYGARKLATNLTKRNVGQAREALVGRGLPRQSLGAAPQASQAPSIPLSLLLALQQQQASGK